MENFLWLAFGLYLFGAVLFFLMVVTLQGMFQLLSPRDKYFFPKAIAASLFWPLMCAVQIWFR